MPETLIGLDVGGTHTDAVCVRGGRIVAAAKVPTTPEVRDGLVRALAALGCADRIERVQVGTTAFTNALVERRGLERSAAIRVGAPVSQSLPPMCDWPPDLLAATGNPVFFLRGGREYDGRPIRPLDRRAIERVARELSDSRVVQAAVTSVFGCCHPDDELRVGEILKRAHPDLEISFSHRIGRFGILERESATLLNAMLRPLAARTLSAYRKALPHRILVSQNDGTLMSAEQACELPVLTLASGPTNSVRGAALLSGVEDAVVVDVGGTTTDVGRLRGGYPQVAGVDLEVAGVRTNFRMPDLCSIGIGGGSCVDPETGEVGPRSVAARLEAEARVFGGETLTLSDLGVAAGRLELGDRSRIDGLDPELIGRVDAHLRRRLLPLIERFGGSGLPVLLVGGGARLLAPVLMERSHVIQPAHADVANAYGAAMAEVGGEVDLTFAADSMTREQALLRAEREARRRAEAAGAQRESIRTIELEDSALAYLSTGGLRVRARAVGPIGENP